MIRGRINPKVVTKYIRTFTSLKSNLILQRQTCFQGPLELFVVTTGLCHEGSKMASTVPRREIIASGSSILVSFADALWASHAMEEDCVTSPKEALFIQTKSKQS